MSFIIPHKGREEMLLQTVDSILKQEYELNQVDIHIVTQNKSLTVLQRLNNDRISIHYETGNQTISRLRNIGAKKSSGDFLAFLDADVSLSSRYVSTMLELLNEDQSRVLVAAMQIDSENAPVLEQIRTVLSNAELNCNVAFLPGRNLFLSRPTFEKVGGFPEHLLTCEDYYFTDKVNELGNLYYSSSAHYVHLGEDKRLDEMYEKEVWRGQSNLKSLSGRSVPLREWPSFFVPPLLVLMVLLAPVLFFVDYIGIALVILLLTISIVAAYSLRLYKLSNKKIALLDIIKFYLVYFPARAKGTVLGVWRSFGVKQHD